MNNTRAVCGVCLGVFFVNLALFGVKLYIGLASNSISIFSDAVNNLFDALGVLLTFAVLYAVLRSADRYTESLLQKSEQLFSFLISIAVTFTGLYFAYSALERFMYPTPVWYTPLYLWALVGGALVKLGLFLFLRLRNKKIGSPVLRMVAFDSLLDFFIACFTVLTLLLSGAEHFSFDALFGLVISLCITVPAVRMLKNAGAALISFVPAAQREKANAVFERQVPGTLRYIKYLRTGGRTEGYAYLEALPDDPAALREAVFAETGIIMYFILSSDKGEQL